jgi:hypothetical protein
MSTIILDSQNTVEAEKEKPVEASAGIVKKTKKV